LTHRQLARIVDAVANQLPVVAGLTTDRRRSVGADAQTLVDLEGTLDRVMRLRKPVQPQNREDA
jgi:hypothetical protein